MDFFGFTFDAPSVHTNWLVKCEDLARQSNKISTGFEQRIQAHLPTLLMPRIMAAKTCRLATLALLFCLLANGAQSAVLGSSVTIVANQSKTILFDVTTTLVITGSADAEVSSLRLCEPVLCQVCHGTVFHAPRSASPCIQL